MLAVAAHLTKIKKPTQVVDSLNSVLALASAAVPAAPLARMPDAPGVVAAPDGAAAAAPVQSAPNPLSPAAQAAVGVV